MGLAIDGSWAGGRLIANLMQCHGVSAIPQHPCTVCVWARAPVRRGRLGEYMELLVGAFNPAAAEGLMCRDTLSVGWDGRWVALSLPAQGALGCWCRRCSIFEHCTPVHATMHVIPSPVLCQCRLFDCDFNQQLELGLVDPRLRSVFDLGSLGGPELVGQAVAVDSHCFGCTAGAGSGCQGATSAA